jgi:hypothetical protein
MTPPSPPRSPPIPIPASPVKLRGDKRVPIPEINGYPSPAGESVGMSTCRMEVRRLPAARPDRGRMRDLPAPCCKTRSREVGRSAGSLLHDQIDGVGEEDRMEVRQPASAASRRQWCGLDPWGDFGSSGASRRVETAAASGVWGKNWGERGAGAG